ncbi:MAG: glucokinase [Psychromonas sp.]|nr:glucokinase [Psychromonas sp.]
MLSIVADVGGTNIRLALYKINTGELSNIKESPCVAFDGLESALEQYFSTLDGEVKQLCIGIACSVCGDIVSMTNLHWTFSQRALKNKFKLQALYVINDFTAISLAVPFLSYKHKIKIGGGEPVKFGTCAVFGPGTGLGVSHILHINDKWISLDGEGGHVNFASGTQAHADVLRLLQKQFGYISLELVLSGSGLVNVYHALCKQQEKRPSLIKPEQIMAAGLSRSCPIAVKTLDIFCEMTGQFAGNLALNLACFGGVYIAGGIIPRFIKKFIASDFRKFFEDKGNLTDYVSAIPTYLITHDNPALLGAGVYLQQALK